MSDPVRVDAGDVTTVTIDRPEALNTLTPGVLEGIEAALDDTEDVARVLVVRSAGDRAFVAGADVEHMRSLSGTEAQSYLELGARVFDRIEAFPAPAIAAIDGYAFGGGCELALACDLRVASERAVIGQTEIDFGVIPGWGGTQRLPRLVGDELARRMIYFGERVDAQDAHEYDLVGDVVAHDEFDEYVAGLAADLADQPRMALRAAKAAINHSHRGGIDAGLAFERSVCAGLFGTPDQREGMDAFVEDREPSFE